VDNRVSSWYKGSEVQTKVHLLARYIDNNGQSPFRSSLLDKVVGQELGDRSSQVDTVDENIHWNEEIDMSSSHGDEIDA
jgi:hypothetical protein